MSMRTQGVVAVGVVTNEANRRDRTINRSEVQTLMPHACVKSLTDFVALAQHVLRDGQITYGEFLRLQRMMEVTQEKMRNSRRIQKMVQEGKRLGKAKPQPTQPAIDVQPALDVDF